MPDADGPHAGKGPREWTADDAHLRAAVVARLTDDRLLDARGVQVYADAGVITLFGETPGASDIAHAELLARSTPGVTAVRNLLTYRPGTRRIDRPDPNAPPEGPEHWATGFVS
jgi:osmotically-inducible protein OsmY